MCGLVPMALMAGKNKLAATALGGATGFALSSLLDKKKKPADPAPAAAATTAAAGNATGY